MKKTYLVISIGLIVALLTAGAYAQPRGGMSNDKPAMMRAGADQGGNIGIILRMKEKLGLTDEQVEQLSAIQNQYQAQLKTAGENIKSAHEQLRNAVEANAGEAAIMQAANQVGNAIGEHAVLRAQVKAEVDQVLTDEQKTQLEAMKEGFKKRIGDRTEKTREQFQKSRKGQMPQRDLGAMFDRIDQDGDGMISEDEFTEHMQQMQQMRPGMRQGTDDQ